jgi:hypothetical protein
MTTDLYTSVTHPKLYDHTNIYTYKLKFGAKQTRTRLHGFFWLL